MEVSSYKERMRAGLGQLESTDFKEENISLSIE